MSKTLDAALDVIDGALIGSELDRISRAVSDLRDYIDDHEGGLGYKTAAANLNLVDHVVLRIRASLA